MTAPLARLVFPSLRWRATGFEHERAKIDAALAAGVGGFILFGGTIESVSGLVRDLQQQAGRALLIGADLERGPGQQVEGLTELPPPAALGYLADTQATRACGIVTASEARAVGINWAFAPVCDLDLEPRNPIVQTRSFGTDPTFVADHAAAWIEGCQGHGVQACAKHYPGHGRTTEDSHATLPRVAASFEELRRTDLVPFAEAIRAGAGSVMSAFVAYPGWDASGGAAGFSREILGYLRDPLGFKGLVVTDALIMAGATAAQAEGPATVAAVAAGCDALLYPTDWQGVVRALGRAAGREISTARADEALGRYEQALGVWGRGEVGPGVTDLTADSQFADSLADRAVHLVRGEAPRLEGPLNVATVDDDVGGPYRVGPRDVFQATLGEAGVNVGKGIVLVYAEPRSWKGRANLGARSVAALQRLAGSARLVVLFAHPRLVEQIPGTAPVLCCWHGQPLMQRAAARWVGARGP